MVYFFFLMIRLTPRSTLFPYTALFRSLLQIRHRHDLATGRRMQWTRIQILDLFRAEQREPPAPQHAAGDRKSTRLNSSHANISYAVICLKKKKLMQTNTSMNIYPNNML